jgi:cysteine synthase A
LVNVEGVLAKAEWVHPTGSIKDRIAQYILKESEKSGLLQPGMRIVEATSGNTGIALAYHGRLMGYKVTIVMPEHMSEERIDILRALGAELILCSKEGGFAEAARIRDEITAADDMVFNPDQFSNPLNVECHRLTTGLELIEQAGVKIDAFVAGVGTGGTLIGVGEALRERWPDVHLAAVEPAESAVMSGGENGPHTIFGIGDGFIPVIVGDGCGGVNSMVDEVIVVSSADALRAASHLMEEHKLGAGTSSGANFLAAQQLQKRFRTVATVFADGAFKYRSCGLRVCLPGECRFPERCEVSILPSLYS